MIGRIARLHGSISVNPAPISASNKSAAERAHFIRDQLPANGLFADMDWRISPAPFALGDDLAMELETLGRVLLQFNRAVNLLYRQSVAGKQPAWVSAWLDCGKPAKLIELQRAAPLKNELPRVIRPDLLVTDHGLEDAGHPVGIVHKGFGQDFDGNIARQLGVVRPIHFTHPTRTKQREDLIGPESLP